MPQAAKPALISGPGAMSQRTDGGPASKQAQRYISGMPNYGDAQELMDLQASAPMAKAQTPTPTQSQQMVGQPQGQQMQQASPISMLAPSQRPNEPVTAGAASGPGPGPEVLRGTQAAQNQGYMNALSLLNQMGEKVDPQVEAIRNALAAHITNTAGR